ncbi:MULTISPECIES: hypothetical protein [Enterobacteriaceae]|uniref:hypothetical protein n=1 Tax=Enterobacteriaceae TaxID=543 RepID=UPI00165982C3|nr:MULTISPECIES: hypothetical protein [Enterobacteriaceae]MBG0541344.1 hypothetical protein [Enterobacter hormaechei]QNQ25586.1 hypothetical protein H9W86_02500 [Enterobacter roggenkampii]QNQ88367.1 hypothetical protein HYE75_21540 [Escherichia coli]
MVQMDYGRCRKYYQYLRCLETFYKAKVNWDEVRFFHSATQYAYLINKLIADNDSLRERRKIIIRDMKAYASATIVPEIYFIWMKDSDRVACYTMFWLASQSEISLPVLNSLKGFSIPSVKSDFNPFINDESDQAVDASYIQSVQELTNFSKGEQYLENPFFEKNSFGFFVDDHANGINFQRINAVSDTVDGYIFNVMLLIDQINTTIDKKISLIGKAHQAWCEHFSRFPRPFKWIDLNEEDNVLWLWDYMRKNHIGCDVLPSSSKQQKYFLLATFDNWAGWTNEQFNKQKENARKVRANPEEPSSLKKLLNPLTPDDCRNVFLDNARNAWVQRRHRQKIKKDTTGIKLTAESRKKLVAIQQLSGVEPNAILKSLIDDAYKRIKEKNKD